MSLGFNVKQKFPTYLIPIVIGMLGVLFAQQIDSTSWRIGIVLLSVAAPVFAGGAIFSQLRTKGAERVLTLIGMVMLCIGAISTASGFVDDLTKLEEVPRGVVDLSRWLGILSLFIGLMAILVLIVRREAAISTMSERFHNLAEHMGDGLILAEADGPIHVVNDRLLTMVGLPRDEVIGLTMQQLADTLGIGDRVAKELKLRAKGHRTEYEVSWFVDGSQHHFWISGAPVVDENGNLIASLATVRDITDKKEMSDRLEKFAQDLQVLVEERTEQLRDSEGRLRDLLVSMNEGFLAFDETFTIDFANPRFLAMMGGAEKDVIGSRAFDYFDPMDRQQLFDAVERMRRGESEAESHEMRLLQKDSTPLSVVLGLSMSRVDEGPTRYAAVVTDVGRLKDMQAQLEGRAEALETANAELLALGRAKDSFLSNVTHELRTPLSTLHGYAEMLISGSLGELTSSQENAVGVMDRNLQRLGTLINEMIEFSRMEIRGVELEWTLFTVDRLVAETIDSMRPQWEAKNLRVIYDADESLGTIWGDRRRIGQVITNLISNAVKFSPVDTVITIAARSDDLGDVMIDVIDQGIGIKPAHQERIFEKFFQVDSSRTRQYEGAGIGLSIAQSIIRAHGGEITVSSVIDEGSRFTLRLPRAKFDRTIPALADLLKGHEVTLLEEQVQTCDAIHNVLANAGAKVASFRNAYACIRHIEESTPDLIIAGPNTAEVEWNEFLRKCAASDGGHGGTALLRICQHGSAIADHESEVPIGRLDMPYSPKELVEATRRCIDFDGETTGQPILAVAPSPRELGILVIDSDMDLREWIGSTLARRNIPCATAENFSEARKRIDPNRPPAIILADADPHSGGRGSLALVAGAKDLFGEDYPALYGLTANENGDTQSGPLTGIVRKPFGVEEILTILDSMESAAPPVHHAVK